MMKKIIGNLIYDTEKAETVLCVETGECPFGLLEDTLYVTKKGNWFLVKESECFDEETGPGICAELVGLTGDEALTWLTKQQAVDAIQTHFPDQLEEA